MSKIDNQVSLFAFVRGLSRELVSKYLGVAATLSELKGR